MRERIKYFDYLRVISAFGVIVLHVAAQHWYTTGITTQEWKIFNSYQSLVRWTVPVFVMISGSMFLQKVLTVRVIWGKYIPRIIGAFVIWSAIYAILFLNDGGTFRETVIMFFTGKYHLWYMFMIVGLYAVIPILKDIADDRDKCSYFLGVAFIMTCLVPTIIDLSDIYVGTIGHIVGKIYNNMSMPVLGIFAFYFVLGYWLDKIDISAKIRKILYALSILGGGYTLVASYVISINVKSASSVVFENYSLNVMLQAVGIFVFAKYNLSNMSELVNRFIEYMAQFTFTVYLAHVLYLEVLEKYFQISAMNNPLVSVPLTSALIFVLSVFTGILCKKVPVLGKYIS